jgi:hypothetical protein
MPESVPCAELPLSLQGARVLFHSMADANSTCDDNAMWGNDGSTPAQKIPSNGMASGPC